MRSGANVGTAREFSSGGYSAFNLPEEPTQFVSFFTQGSDQIVLGYWNKDQNISQSFRTNGGRGSITVSGTTVTVVSYLSYVGGGTVYYTYL